MVEPSRAVELSEYFHTGTEVVAGWSWFTSPAGEYLEPSQLSDEQFESCASPSTVAGALRSRGELSRDEPPDLDGQDHWYRASVCAVDWPREDVGGRRTLVFDGLATVAIVWFNGERVLEAENMYRRFAVDVTDLLRPQNEIVICFGALTPRLKTRKGPRRWPTRIVSERNLRFFRTTLLGRMPGWTPPWPAVGPFRPVRLVSAEAFIVHELRAAPSIDDEGPRVDVSVVVSVLNDAPPPTADFEIADHSYALSLEAVGGGRWAGRVTARPQGVEPWWPHTHGAQPLYAAQLRLRSGGREEAFDLGCLGFRALRLLPSERFGFELNGVEVFCRGACWTPLDIVTLGASARQLREALEQVKAAGMNMLRVAGVMTYETRAFHDLCDELGILVWQDFMFANMDYPRADARFDAEVEAEVSQLLERIGRCCSTALLCGGSETEQQAAMMGIAESDWRHPLWREQLPMLVGRYCTSVPYWHSSPGGRGLPFWPHDGCTHYFGVGAYQRDFSDARVAGVRFASECLAFANPPEPGGAFESQPDQPLGRVPRDAGASWDFADVTEHYVVRLFGQQARELRHDDPEAYLRLARQAVAIVARRVQGDFRDPATECRGSIILMLRDFEPGSGWGVIDALGKPKAMYHALAAAWAARSVWLVDEGLSGLTAVIANDPAEPLDATLVIRVLGHAGNVQREHAEALHVDGHGYRRVRVEEVLGAFFDSTYSYRFGPLGFARIEVALQIDGRTLSEDIFEPRVDPAS